MRSSHLGRTGRVPCSNGPATERAHLTQTDLRRVETAIHAAASFKAMNRFTNHQLSDERTITERIPSLPGCIAISLRGPRSDAGRSSIFRNARENERIPERTGRRACPIAQLTFKLIPQTVRRPLGCARYQGRTGGDSIGGEVLERESGQQLDRFRDVSVALRARRCPVTDFERGHAPVDIVISGSPKHGRVISAIEYPEAMFSRRVNSISVRVMYSAESPTF